MTIQSISFDKEPGGVVIATNGNAPLSVPFGFNSIVPTSDTVVCVDVANWNGILVTTKQSITINKELFAGSAIELAAKLRNEVFTNTQNYLVP